VWCLRVVVLHVLVVVGAEENTRLWTAWSRVRGINLTRIKIYAPPRSPSRLSFTNTDMSDCV
jgi:hypothetical protein